MPKLETIIIAHETLVKITQDHKRVISWYNIPPSANFFSEIYHKSYDYDVFGIVPHPFSFSSKRSLTTIMSQFNKNMLTNACIIASENKNGLRPFFINRKLFEASGVLDMKTIGSYCAKNSFNILHMKGLFKVI